MRNALLCLMLCCTAAADPGYPVSTTPNEVRLKDVLLPDLRCAIGMGGQAFAIQVNDGAGNWLLVSPNPPPPASGVADWCLQAVATRDAPDDVWQVHQAGCPPALRGTSFYAPLNPRLILCTHVSANPFRVVTFNNRTSAPAGAALLLFDTTITSVDSSLRWDIVVTRNTPNPEIVFDDWSEPWFVLDAAKIASVTIDGATTTNANLPDWSVAQNQAVTTRAVEFGLTNGRTLKLSWDSAGMICCGTCYTAGPPAQTGLVFTATETDCPCVVGQPKSLGWTLEVE